VQRVPVDIVVATNRGSRYLPEALASVRAQSYRDWRLIVVDDGSPDHQALRALIGDMPRTTIIRHAHRGLPASRNVGITHGDAPLIALLDDDDVWHEDKLLSQIRALEDRPDALASFTAGRYVDANGEEFGSGWPANTVPSDQFVSGEEPQPRIVSLMVRRGANEEIGGFNESYSLAEDNEYILRLALHGPMVAVPQSLVSYRRHSTNMSSSDSLEGRQANLRLLREAQARHATDQVVGQLLSERLDRFLDVSSAECARGIAQALRRGEGASLAAELRWATGTSPVRTMRAIASKLMTAL
jgi:glycosyltransferase involved in cell wall biosynthesis